MPDSYRSRWSGMAFHSLLQRRFAPRKVVHLPSLFPVLFHDSTPDRFFTPFENDGRYLIFFCKKPFSVSAHTYILFFPFCSHLPLPTANAATFPVFGDSFRFISFSSSPKSHSTPHRNAIHSCRHSWAVEVCEWVERHSRVMSVSEESGSEYRKTHLILVSFAGFLPLPLVGYGVSLTFAASLCSLEKWFTCHHSFPYFFITIFPTAFSFRSRITGRYLVPFRKKLFYVSAHTCPFWRLRRHLSLKAKRLTHFYSVALLLEKWFACFPSSRDGFLYKLFDYFCSCFRYLVYSW